jgi:hypothetical protein
LREGEIIPLVLSFTSTVYKRYHTSKYDRSGRLDTEIYCLEPQARGPLAGYFSTTASIRGLSGGPEQSRTNARSARTADRDRPPEVVR